MVGILLVSHGEMANGIKDSVNLIVGDVANIETSSLVAGQDIDALKADILVKYEKLDCGEGVLVFVDLFGASPYNASLSVYQKLKAENKLVRVVTGMNLSMILETSVLANTMSLDELAMLAVNTGRDGIVEAIAAFENMNEEDEGDY